MTVVSPFGITALAEKITYIQVRCIYWHKNGDSYNLRSDVLNKWAQNFFIKGFDGVINKEPNVNDAIYVMESWFGVVKFKDVFFCEDD